MRKCCRYTPTAAYLPARAPRTINGFTLDSKNVNFDLYEDFLKSQTRFNMLKAINPEKANELLNANKDYSLKTFNYYESLANNETE